MSWQFFFPKSLQFLKFLLVSLPLLTTPAFSQPAPPASPDPTFQYVPPPPRGSNRGGPARQTSTGTRAPCNAEAATGFLTALVPKSGEALTVAERPTFWAYIPNSAEQIDSLEFALWATEDVVIKSLQLDVSNTLPGIIHIELPEVFPNLEIDREYQWSLTLSCNSQQSTPPFVQGSIRRVALSSALVTALETAGSNQAKAAVYAENGIWYDALTALGLLYAAEPNRATLEANWQALLSALQIDFSSRNIDFDSSDIATQPLVDCCQPAENSTP